MKRTVFRPIAFLLAPLCAFFCVSCAPLKHEETFFALDTYNTITVYGTQDALIRAREMVFDFEARVSNTLPDSEVSRINAHAETGVEVSETVADLVRQSLAASRLTNGAFDCTVAPLVAAYGFYTGDYRVPDEQELNALCKLVDSESVSVTGTRVTVGARQSIDLGGIAKGYLGDLCADLLRENGASAGIISLGGNVRAFGEKPGDKLFSVAVTDPIDRASYLGTVRFTDASLVTAGAYQRNFVKDGKFYHHIIDPRTGLCADSGLASVSVLCASGAKADALSTACFILGEEAAFDLWRAEGDFELILVRDDGSVVLSGGLEGRFQSALADARELIWIKA